MQKPKFRSISTILLAMAAVAMCSTLTQAQDAISYISPSKGDLDAPSEAMLIYAGKYLDVQPSFLGGEPALKTFISENLTYPNLARQYGVEGTVHVEFVIDEEGNASQPWVYRKIGYGCDQEVERIISQMPRWRPGIKGAASVASRVHLAIHFRLHP